MSVLDIVTHGCRLNIAESEAIRAALGGSDNLVIVNKSKRNFFHGGDCKIL